MSQAEVARRLEVSTTYVQRLEAGLGNLTLGQLLRVAEALEAYPRVSLEPLPDTAAALSELAALTD
jgi:transcriptional regulator with XRE-family HTH domain